MSTKRPARSGAPRGLRAVAGLALALLASGPAAAMVTTYYTWHEADGTSVFSNQVPPSGVRRFDLHTVATARPDADRQADITAELARDRALVTAPLPPEPPDAAAVDSARERLARAIDERRLGRQPLPGERLHNEGDGSRLAPWYFARQQRLDAAVDKARVQLAEAEGLRERALQ